MDNEAHRKYLEKSGDDEIFYDNYTENEHGFCSWTVNEYNELSISQCYGDGNYWLDYFIAKAKELGCKRLIMGTRRNPKTFERKFNFRTIAYIMVREIEDE